MPSDLPLPIRTSATYQHLLLIIISIDVFLKIHFLVISLPLTKTVLYNLYHVLPFQREDSKFTFTQPEHGYLLMDSDKWYFTRLGVDVINDYKIVSSIRRVRKQTQPVQLTHMDEECECRYLLPVHEDLENLTIQFGHSLTTMNEWIYAAP